MKHVIRTQVFEVTTNKKDDAFELQQRMSDLFYSVILPVIEKIFDEVAPGNQYIYLEKMEIDIGKIRVEDLTAKTWDMEFREIFTRQFRDKVNITSDKKIGLPFSYSIAQQWLYYMKKGYLPWNTTSTGSDWLLKVLEGFAQDYTTIEELRQLIRTDSRAVRRMVMLHDNFFLTHLAEVLTAVKQEKLKVLIERIVEVFKKDGTPSMIAKRSEIMRRRVWETIMEKIVTRKNSIQPVEIISDILLQAFTYPEIEMIYRKADEDETLRPLVQTVKKIIDKGPVSAIKKKEEMEVLKENVKKERSKVPEEGLFVNDAGLVLLHPFLNRFFTYLQLVADNAFINETTRQQSMILLHYLATGRLDFEEHELVIPKCLCNYNLEETVDPFLLPTKEMIDECDELLKDVIAQWTVLKNTSPEGLRVNFLQRTGKLYTKNDEPHLLVEASVFDVLLDRLPWGIGMIRLPWMEKVLRVEWR